VDGSGGQPLGGCSRRPIGQIVGKVGGKDNRTGCDAGKQVKGRKIHALVAKDCGCGSSSASPRSGTTTGRASPQQVHRSFPWLELICADGGHDGWQLDAAVVPPLRRRSSSGATTRRALSSCRAAGSSSVLSLGSDETGVSPRILRTLPKPWPPLLLSPTPTWPLGGLPGRWS
jgi:hypothetical protein